MSNMIKTINHIKAWEGGWVDDKDDKGGCTNSGITLATYRQIYPDKNCDDLKRLTPGTWNSIFMQLYWNPCRAFGIANDSICTLIVDMCWMSGVKTSIKKIQKVLGVKEDGIVGPITLSSINSRDQRELFDSLVEMRKNWLETIASKGTNKKYLQGWLNRLNSIRYVEKPC